MLQEVFQIIHNSKNWEETYISNSREIVKLWRKLWVFISCFVISVELGDTL